MVYSYSPGRLLIFFSMTIFLHFLSPQTITATQATSRPLMKLDSGFAGPVNMWEHFCINSSGTYNQSSQYQMGLDVIVSWINDSPNLVDKFYNASFGEVHVIGSCRGDSSNSTCLSCLADAANKLPQKCPIEKEAIAYYEACMFRYSNRAIFHKMETSPNACLIGGDASDVNLLNRTRTTLFKRLKNQALANTGSSSSSSLIPYFAMGEINATGGNLTLYGMIQCTPDITKSACSDCIDGAIQDLLDPQCSYSQAGGRVLMPSCNVRYEYGNFFYSQPSLLPPPPPPPPPPATSKKGTKSKTSKYVIATIVPIVAILALAAFLYACIRRRKLPMLTQQVDGDMSSVDSLQFDFNAIKAATNNFSTDSKLGQGGFGAVYKGKLWNGQEIAVKRLASNNSGQGEVQFKNEIMLLAKLQHRNLVRLLGFCLDKEERLLIYEFVPNASLDHFLFDSEKHEYLDWQKRTKIIGGIARGLLYLHEDSRLRIIHRDLKAGNVLLDAEMNPKIADFGLAKLFLADQTHEDTSRIAGTYGYMAPEYVLHGLFSVKADVYSFGILLLEIICGRRNRDVEENTISLTSLVWRSWREGTILSMVDPTILARDSSLGSEITRYMHIGLLCVQEKDTERPTMSMVALMLSTDSLSLPLPTNPGFISSPIHPRQHNYSDQSCDALNGTSSINEDSFSHFLPR